MNGFGIDELSYEEMGQNWRETGNATTGSSNAKGNYITEGNHIENSSNHPKENSSTRNNQNSSDFPKENSSRENYNQNSYNQNKENIFKKEDTKKSPSSLLRSISYDLSDIPLLSRISTLFHCYLEMNMSMFRTNNSFTIDPELEPSRLSSRPWEWLILHRGLRINTYLKDDELRVGHKMFYMFGNPFSWYLALICIILCFIKINDVLLRPDHSTDQLAVLRSGDCYFVLFQGWCYRVERDRFYRVERGHKQMETIYRINLSCQLSGNSILGASNSILSASNSILSANSSRILNANSSSISSANSSSISSANSSSILNANSSSILNANSSSILSANSSSKTESKTKSKKIGSQTVESLFYQPLTHFSLLVIICYLCHYLPFYFIKRILYFHHYFPALLFKLLSIAIILQLIGNKRRIEYLIIALVIAQIGCFIVFRKCVYGFRQYQEMWDLFKCWDYIER